MAKVMADSVLCAYLQLASGRIDRTVEISADLMVDVDETGRPLGIEALGRPVDLGAVLEVLKASRLP